MNDIEEKIKKINIVKGDGIEKSATSIFNLANLTRRAGQGLKYLDDFALRGPANPNNSVVKGDLANKLKKLLNVGEGAAAGTYSQIGDRDVYGTANYFANMKGNLNTEGDPGSGMWSPEKIKNHTAQKARYLKYKGALPTDYARPLYPDGRDIGPSVYDRVSAGLTAAALGTTKGRRFMTSNLTGWGFTKPLAKLGLPMTLGVAEGLMGNTKDIGNVTDGIKDLTEGVKQVTGDPKDPSKPGALNTFADKLAEFGKPIKKYALPIAGVGLGGLIGSAGGNLLSNDVSGMSEKERREEERRQRTRKSIMALAGMGIGGFAGAYTGGAFDKGTV